MCTLCTVAVSNHKFMREMEHVSRKERLGELELFSLEKRGLPGDRFMAFQYLEGTLKTGTDLLVMPTAVGQGIFTLN